MYVDPFVAGVITGSFGWFLVIVILAILRQGSKK